MKKLQVFISSTYTDLISERLHVVETVLSMGHIPAGMELFCADNKKQFDVIKQWIRDSDIFLLILGGKFGSIDPETQKSYIQLEYEYARKIGKKPITLVLDKKGIEIKLAEKIYDPDNPEYMDKKYIEFKDSIVNSKLCAFFNDVNELKFAVSKAIRNCEKSFAENSGWIPVAGLKSYLLDEANIVKLLGDDTQNFVGRIFEQVFLKRIAKSNCSRSVFRSLSEDMALVDFSHMQSCIYDRSFSRNVEITLYDDDIQICSTTTVLRMNPAKEKHTFRQDPMFKKEKEFYSFDIKELMYNDEEYHDANNPYCQYELAPRTSQTNPKNICGKKIVIDISENEINEIKIVTVYRTDYNLFFQSFWFKVPCEKFTLCATLDDQRHNKDERFMIRWEFFCASDEKNRIARSRMKAEDHFIQIMQPVEWVQPGSGFMLSLNENRKPDK